MINVVNRKGRTPQPNDIYIGRGSPLGNPHPMSDESDRDTVCELYEQHIAERIALKDRRITIELRRIYIMHKQYGSVNLVCFCKPKRCHGDSIKELLCGLSI